MKVKLLKKVRKRFSISSDGERFVVRDAKIFGGYIDRDFNYLSHALFYLSEVFHKEYDNNLKTRFKIVWPKQKKPELKN